MVNSAMKETDTVKGKKGVEMTRGIKVKNCVIGEGMPKICVPVTGRTEEEILKQAEQIAVQGPDLAEWRVDFYEEIGNDAATVKLAGQLRKSLGGIPVLFTFRTAAEGGNKEISPREYEHILLLGAKCGEVDLVDVEVMGNPERSALLIKKLRECGVCVIGSNHHFHETPENEKMEEILETMQQVGADILKLAVMPHTPSDVLRLLAVTESFGRKTEKPLITMSMGKTGVISRLCGETFGSAVTFGSVCQASAPGQINMAELRKILQLLHE